MAWTPIPEFPGYSVSHEGVVRNDDSGHILTPSANQSGVMQVGMMKNGSQYKRGLARLVAQSFLPPHKLEAFDTPINLDGNRLNNHVNNLMWRPRWFAVKYHQQFHNDRRGFDKPIIDTKSKEVFPTSWDAAVKYGLLDREIMLAIMNRTYVWPTYQEFELLEF